MGDFEAINKHCWMKAINIYIETQNIKVWVPSIYILPEAFGMFLSFCMAFLIFSLYLFNKSDPIVQPSYLFSTEKLPKTHVYKVLTALIASVRHVDQIDVG